MRNRSSVLKCKTVWALAACAFAWQSQLQQVRLPCPGHPRQVPIWRKTSQPFSLFVWVPFCSCAILSFSGFQSLSEDFLEIIMVLKKTHNVKYTILTTFKCTVQEH